MPRPVSSSAADLVQRLRVVDPSYHVEDVPEVVVERLSREAAIVCDIGDRYLVERFGL